MSRKLFETNSLAEVFELDNSARNRIGELVLTLSAAQPDSTHTDHEIEVDFDGVATTEITINIDSDNSKWANDTLSIVEEQVERTLQRDLMHKLLKGEWFFFVMPLFFLIVMVIAATTLSGERDHSKSVDTMWLSDNDLNQLDVDLQNTANLNGDKMAEVFTRQIRNIISAHKEADQQKKKSTIAVLRDWRWLFIVLPLLIILASFIFVARCYPRVIFLWGDAEEWYQKLIIRRKAIWSLIIGAMFVGILSNLFVFGLSGFLH